MDCNKQPVSCTPTAQSRTRTNIVPLKPIKFFVPDHDDCVHYVSKLGQCIIDTAQPHSEEDLISGYFSALCAVLPDLTNIAKKVMKNLGFQAVEITIPSQTDKMNIEIPRSQNLRLEIIKFAQLCFLPFQKKIDSDVEGFWGKVAKKAGVVTDGSFLMLCSVERMKTINTALVCSQIKGELQSSIASSLRELAIEKSPFGRIIFEATKRAGRWCSPYCKPMKYATSKHV